MIISFLIDTRKFDPVLQETGEKYCKNVLDEISEKILPGMGHWNHPEMCGWYPVYAGKDLKIPIKVFSLNL